MEKYVYINIKAEEPEIKLLTFTESERKQESSLKTSTSVSSEKAMATHSSTLAWKIPWTEEPGRLPSMGLQRAGHDWSNLAAAGGDGGLLRYEMQNQSRMRLQPPRSCPGTSSIFRHTALPRSSTRIRSKAWGNRQEIRREQGSDFLFHWIFSDDFRSGLVKPNPSLLGGGGWGEVQM